MRQLKRLSRTAEKIQGLDALARNLDAVRADGNKVVHCHGVFDVMHIGHIRHFEQARGLGDVLVVTLTPDRYVNKGPHRPVFNEALRAEAIAALDCVDHVAVNEWPTAVETIRLLRPQFYVKGSDYRDASNDRTGGIAVEQETVESVGGQIAFTEDITFSSSSLVNRHMSVFPEEVSSYLDGFSSRYSSNDILQFLEAARSLKVLVIGEAIVDEYCYCHTMGKSGKEPVLAARYTKSERFAGGILAVANHVAGFSDDVDILTFLGVDDRNEDFIHDNLDPKINKIFLPLEQAAQTIVKRRYVEGYPFQKLFELYYMDDIEGRPGETEALCTRLKEVLPNYDLVVVADYGHGMLGPEAIEILCDEARFLCVNTQANAGNQGFNTVSKYRRADYLSVSEQEIRLEARSTRRALDEIVLDVGTRLSCDRILITQGEQGILCYGREEGFVTVPAFSTSVVDRVGAGDAVFSVTALCAAQQAPMEITGFIGNAVGAQAVATVGHRSSIQRVPLFRYIESLMK